MIQITTLVYCIIMAPLVYYTFKPDRSYGDYNFTKGLGNVVAFIGIIVFNLIWGGIFWW
jgi:hypothetical protein